MDEQNTTQTPPAEEPAAEETPVLSEIIAKYNRTISDLNALNQRLKSQLEDRDRAIILLMAEQPQSEQVNPDAIYEKLHLKRRN